MPMYVQYVLIRLIKWIWICYVAKKFGVNHGWVGGGGKNGANKWTNYKNYKIILYAFCFHLITDIYIRVQFLFLKRGVCFYWVACFYWDIYGMHYFNNLHVTRPHKNPAQQEYNYVNWWFTCNTTSYRHWYWIDTSILTSRKLVSGLGSTEK